MYTDWGLAQEQIVGWKGPKYKKFATREEAEAFVEGGGLYTKPATTSVKPKKIPKSTDKTAAGFNKIGDGTSAELLEEDADGAFSKRHKREADSLKRASIRQGLENKNVLQPVSASVEGTGASKPSQKGIIRIYTDGSSRGNGKLGASAGVGVFFGNGDPRSVTIFNADNSTFAVKRGPLALETLIR